MHNSTQRECNLQRDGELLSTRADRRGAARGNFGRPPPAGQGREKCGCGYEDGQQKRHCHDHADVDPGLEVVLEGRRQANGAKELDERDGEQDAPRHPAGRPRQGLCQQLPYNPTC